MDSDAVERLAKDRSDLLRQVFDKNHRIAALEAALRDLHDLFHDPGCNADCRFNRALVGTSLETKDE